MFLHDVLRSHLNDELEQRGAPMRVEDLCPQYDGDNFIGAHLTNSRWQGTLRLPWITAEVQGSYEGRLRWAREAASSILVQYIDLDAEMEAILRQKAQDQVARRVLLYPKLVAVLGRAAREFHDSDCSLACEMGELERHGGDFEDCAHELCAEVRGALKEAGE